MLTKDVENVGTAGDIKSVADGFGRNYLIPRHLAVVAGRGVETEAKRIRSVSARHEAKAREQAQDLASLIENKTVVCRLRVGEEGRVFGAVTSEDIARALFAQHNVEVDRRRIELPEPIKQLGEHEVNLRLHRDVAAHINLIVTQDR
ncbi:MAG: 50S ribosomal protein L9 [Candidatus Dormiibacterota bacterium]